MATVVTPDVTLSPVSGEPRPIEDWVTVFHIVLVIVDPYTHESSWLIKTAGRILRNFREADCRVGWLVAGTDEQAKSFLGPWCEELLTFVDPERKVIEALGLERLPAIVHIDHSLNLVASAEGWNPSEWRSVSKGLAEQMSWNSPAIPIQDDPTPYSGAPAV